MLLHKKLLNRFAEWLIIGLRPLLGPALCYYDVSCSIYALECLRTHSLVQSFTLIFKRIMSCNPIFAWFGRMNRFKAIAFCLSLSLTQESVCLPTLTTQDISVNECNPEFLRSKEKFLQLLAIIRETCTMSKEQDAPKVRASTHGLSVVCEIEEPRAYILLIAENASNKLYCSIISQHLTKKQKQTIEETMIRLFRAKTSQ